MLCFGLLSVSSLLLISSSSVGGDRFVILHPFYSGSHVLTLHTVADSLIQRGHQVTTVRFGDPHNFELKNLGPNHTDFIIYLNNENETIPFTTVSEEGVFHMPMEVLWSRGSEWTTLFTLPHNPWRIVDAYCTQLLNSARLNRFLTAQKPDVFIIDLIYNECALSIARSMDVPYVGYWAFSFAGCEPEFTSVSTPASYIPTFMSKLPQFMSFRQRVINFVLKSFSHAVMYFNCWFCDLIVESSDWMASSAVSTSSPHHSASSMRSERRIPGTQQLLAELNGALINTDNILDYARLQPQTYVNVGGMQIPKNVKDLPPLPEDIEAFIEGAEEGVLLFSMGFIFDPRHIPSQHIQRIFNALSKLPQRSLVKLDNFEPSNSAAKQNFNISSNIMVRSFLPQQSILSHPKTILFFSHCGMHGIMEAIWYRVPIIGMPIFIDQGDVLTRVEEKGIGAGVEKFADTSKIHETIVKVRDDERYQVNINRLSKLMRTSRKSHPMDEAISLLEFISRTKGGDHLTIRHSHLSLLQYYCLDVIAFMFLSLQTSFYILRYVNLDIYFRRQFFDSRVAAPLKT